MLKTKTWFLDELLGQDRGLATATQAALTPHTYLSVCCGLLAILKQPHSKLK